MTIGACEDLKSTWLGHLFMMGYNKNEGVMDTKWRLWSKRANRRGEEPLAWICTEKVVDPILHLSPRGETWRRRSCRATSTTREELRRHGAQVSRLVNPITRYVAPQRGQRNERLVRTTNNEPVLFALTHLWYLLQILIFTGIISDHDMSH